MISGTRGDSGLLSSYWELPRCRLLGAAQVPLVILVRPPDSAIEIPFYVDVRHIRLRVGGTRDLMGMLGT